MAAISRIIIDQQYAQIGVKVTRAQMHISTPQPQMQVNSEMPEMTVETQAPKFKLNWKKVQAESGLKRPIPLTLDIRDKSRQKILENTAKASRDGDFLAKVEQPGDRVVQIARRDSLQQSTKELNLGLMPKSKPEVEWTRGAIRIDWSRPHFDIEWTREYLPEIVIDPPYSVEIYLRREPYFKITVESGEDPFKVSRYVRHSV
jgi:hypothetical protein